MNDDIFNSSIFAPVLVNGKINLTDKEINYIIESYAVLFAGYDSKLGKTIGLQNVHRKTIGIKVWEKMTENERRQEFFTYLKNDLEFTLNHLGQGGRVDYLVSRALDPLDPMRNFYKVYLVKLGAEITNDGVIRISRNLKEKIENLDLRIKPIIDFSPVKEFEISSPKHVLRLRPNYFREI